MMLLCSQSISYFNVKHTLWLKGNQTATTVVAVGLPLSQIVCLTLELIHFRKWVKFITVKWKCNKWINTFSKCICFYWSEICLFY